MLTFQNILPKASIFSCGVHIKRSKIPITVREWLSEVLWESARCGKGLIDCSPQWHGPCAASTVGLFILSVWQIWMHGISLLSSNKLRWIHYNQCYPPVVSRIDIISLPGHSLPSAFSCHWVSCLSLSLWCIILWSALKLTNLEVVHCWWTSEMGEM